MYPVVEVFGPTIQGEGIYTGLRTMFIRLAGCDFRCQWCDTTYAMDKNLPHLSPKNIVKQINLLAPYCKIVTITGGNPCIHDLDPLITILHDTSYEIHLETQGSIWQDCLKKVDMINLSPKPPSSGMQHRELALTKFVTNADNIQFKIVVLTLEDYKYAQELHQQYPDIPMVLQVCQEVKRDTINNLMAKYRSLVAKISNDPGFNDKVRVLPQMHILAWGQQRGI
ncbi:MAG: 7-carboxy-7-deazaguanine synthase QueE [Syntrophomonadaceae bacterium]|jgi:7-carboxy-7-deazaguanine synthase